MLDNLRVHLIKDQSDFVLFFCDTLSIKKITDRCAQNYLSKLQNICSSTSNSTFYVNMYDASQLNLTDEFTQSENSQNPIHTASDEKFSTLILHITNDCNMMCKYCFANHGLYASDRGLMSPQTAIRAIEIYYKRYGYIREIKFFGGEPMMNTETIREVCVHVHKMLKRKAIQQLPRFKIITNGTILNPEFISTIVEYKIQVVFSIDGPSEIHDKLRYFRGGRASYDLIMSNFKKLKDYTNGEQPCSIEATYTKAHEEAGYSIAEIIRYFYDKLGMNKGQVNISMVNLPFSNPLSLPDYSKHWISYVEEVKKLQLETGRFYGDLKIIGMLNRLKNKKCIPPDELCPAGHRWAAVSAKGEIYPCLMFTDNEFFKMGNVYDEDVLNSALYKKITSDFSNIHPQENEPCKNCFVNNVCGKCAGINHFMTGNVACTDHMHCQAIRKVFEVLISGIANDIF